jgi:murein DD-endopeptidase MepM/ murein hydrolase activator NlpD
MTKAKYYFDSESLSYRKVESSNVRRVRNFLAFLVASFFFGGLILLFLINSPIINTPTELAQARELENYKLQFELLDKKMDQIESVLTNLQDRDNNIYRIIFETNPIPDDVRKAGFGGINRYQNLEGYNNSNLVIETTRRLDILSKQLVVQSKSLDEIHRLAKDKEALLEAIPSIQPIKNEDVIRMASGFGYRTDPFTKKRKKHKGMDFSAKRNTPVYAPSDGVVTRADSRSSGYGKHIRINHGFGYTTLYAHLNKYNVRRGQKVKRGEIIGYVGSTGRSKAPHLHYEVFKDKVQVNPIHFYNGNLTAAEYDELLALSSIENQSLD